MTNYNDGKWHGWNGGECPVHPKTEVTVKLSCNGVETEVAPANCFNEFWTNKDICAFRVVKEFRDPRELWVNEYKHYFTAHSTKERADKCAGNSRISCRHYREVIE